MNALLGGKVFPQSIDGWQVRWESSREYRHWCLQSKPGHSVRLIVVMKNPGSLSGDGANLRRDTTLRILRRVGEAVRADWLVLNLFDYAAARPRDLHANWHKRDADALVFSRLDLDDYLGLIFAHGNLPAQYHSEYSERLQQIRRDLAQLREIHLPKTTKTAAGYPMHPMHWQIKRLLPCVESAIAAGVRGA